MCLLLRQFSLKKFKSVSDVNVLGCEQQTCVLCVNKRRPCLNTKKGTEIEIVLISPAFLNGAPL